MKRRNILHVFYLNLKSNKLFILIALCIIPVLYSGLNIWAVSTVYDNTSKIAVAVVNNDKPVTVDRQTIDIGGTLVKSLKSNHDLDWHFVTGAEADSGLLNDKYYAAFVIPADFSRKITSVTTGKPVKPQITYKVNNKLNGFGTKVTGTAKSSLQNQISSSFVSTVSSAVGQSLARVGTQLKGHEYELLAFKYLVINTDQNMDATVETLNGYQGKADDMGSLADGMQSILPAVQNIDESLEDMNQSQADLLRSTTGNVDSVGMILDYADSQIGQIQQSVTAIENNAKAPVSADDINAQLDSVIAGLDRASVYLSNVEAAGNEEKLQKVISDLTALQSEINTADNRLGELYASLQQAKADTATAVSKLNTAITQAIGLLQKLDSQLSTAASDLTSLNGTIKTQTADIVGTIDSAVSLNNKLIQELETLQSESGGTAAAISAALAQAAAGVSGASGNLTALSDAIGTEIAYLKNLPNTASLVSSLTALQNQIGTVQGDLNSLAALLQAASGNTAGIQQKLDAALTQAISALQALDSQLGDIETEIKSMSQSAQNQISGLISEIDSQIDADNELIQELEETQVELNSGASGLLTALGQASSDIIAVRQKLAALSDGVGKAIQYVSTLKAEVGEDNARLSNVVDSLNRIVSYLQDEKTRVTALGGMVHSAGADAAKLKSDLNADLSAVSTLLRSAREEYRSKVSAYVDQINAGLLQFSADSTRQSETASGGIRQLSGTLTLQKNISTYLSACIADLKTALLQSKPEIHTLSTRLGGVSDNNILNLMRILETGSMKVVEDFSHPIEVASETVYAIPNNASNMAPLYTVISLWLGAYILATGLKRTRENTLLFRTFGRVEGYLGQMLTFAFISMTQGLLIALTNILILRIYVCSKFLFAVDCMFISLIFSVIVFSLVELFGRVGKSLCAVYMILQLTGSGGSYPIQVVPPVLQAFHALLPYTYAVNGLREAVSGPTLFDMLVNTGALLLFGAAFFAVGLKGNRIFADRVYGYSQEFQDCGLGR